MSSRGSTPSLPSTEGYHSAQDPSYLSDIAEIMEQQASNSNLSTSSTNNINNNSSNYQDSIEDSFRADNGSQHDTAIPPRNFNSHISHNDTPIEELDLSGSHNDGTISSVSQLSWAHQVSRAREESRGMRMGRIVFDTLVMGDSQARFRYGDPDDSLPSILVRRQQDPDSHSIDLSSISGRSRASFRRRLRQRMSQGQSSIDREENSQPSDQSNLHDAAATAHRPAYRDFSVDSDISAGESDSTFPPSVYSRGRSASSDSESSSSGSNTNDRRVRFDFPHVAELAIQGDDVDVSDGSTSVGVPDLDRRDSPLRMDSDDESHDDSVPDIAYREETSDANDESVSAPRQSFPRDHSIPHCDDELSDGSDEESSDGSVPDLAVREDTSDDDSTANFRQSSVQAQGNTGGRDRSSCRPAKRRRERTSSSESEGPQATSAPAAPSAHTFQPGTTSATQGDQSRSETAQRGASAQGDSEIGRLVKKFLDKERRPGEKITWGKSQR